MPELALALYAMIALVVMVYAGKDRLADLSLYLTAPTNMDTTAKTATRETTMRLVSDT